MAYEVPHDSRSPHDGPTTIRQSAELFGKVASYPPEELIKAHGFAAVKAAIDLADQERIEATGEGYDGFYKELVEYGYRDTAAAIEDLAPGKSVEDRVESLRDPRTMVALGRLADRSEVSMQGVLTNDSNYGNRLKVDTDPDGRQYLRMIEESHAAEAETNRRSGCPFAAMSADMMPSMPYVKFAQWAGEVMIRIDQLDFEMRAARLKQQIA